MAQSTEDKNPHDEKTRLLISDDTGGNPYRRNDVVGIPGSKKHQKRRNSDGSLDFERIVNVYSIQGELPMNAYPNASHRIDYRTAPGLEHA